MSPKSIAEYESMSYLDKVKWVYKTVSHVNMESPFGPIQFAAHFVRLLDRQLRREKFNEQD